MALEPKMLGKCWENAGKMLGKWLGKCWENAGKMLGKCWENMELKKIYGTWRRCWEDVGDMIWLTNKGCWENPPNPPWIIIIFPMNFIHGQLLGDVGCGIPLQCRDLDVFLKPWQYNWIWLTLGTWLFKSEAGKPQAPWFWETHHFDSFPRFIAMNWDIQYPIFRHTNIEVDQHFTLR